MRISIRLTLIGLVLLIVSAALSHAETKTYVMPDGSKVVVDVPPGMTHTEQDALSAWKAQQKFTLHQTISEPTTSGDRFNKDIAVLEQRMYEQDRQKARDIMFEREQVKNERLKKGMDSVQYRDYNINANVNIRRR